MLYFHLQIRSFTDGQKKMETGFWVFRDGLEGASINIPLLGRNSMNYTENYERFGKCDVMTFRTREKSMAGAIEMNQHLKGLKPILAGDGSILYYEKNFTSQQVLQMSLKRHSRYGRSNDISSTSNYLYSTVIHRVKINENGQCVPLSFLRVVFFGTSCSWDSIRTRPMRSKPVPTLVEYFYAADEKAYKPGEIGRFDRTIPQLSCSNDFASLDQAQKKVVEAFESGKCVKSDALNFYLSKCCQMDYETYKKSPQCNISKYNLFKPIEEVRPTICERRIELERGTTKIHYRDRDCLRNHKEFKIW